MIRLAKSEAVNGCIGFILAFRQAGSHQVTQALSGIAVPIVQQRADVVLGRAEAGQVVPGSLQDGLHHVLLVVGQLAILVAVGNANHQGQ